MSDVAYLDNPYAKRPSQHYGLAAMARKAAARDESIPVSGVAPLCVLPFKPYVYQGTGTDTLTAFMDEQPVEYERLSKRQERMEMLAELRLWTGGENEPPAGYVTARQAAELIGVSKRTVERYKRDLAAATAERTGRNG